MILIFSIFSDDGTNTERLEFTVYKFFLNFLETCNFDGMFKSLRLVVAFGTRYNFRTGYFFKLF